jgi:hypothetical protein
MFLIALGAQRLPGWDGARVEGRAGDTNLKRLFFLRNFERGMNSTKGEKDDGETQDWNTRRVARNADRAAFRQSP